MSNEVKAALIANAPTISTGLEHFDNTLCIWTSTLRQFRSRCRRSVHALHDGASPDTVTAAAADLSIRAFRLGYFSTEDARLESAAQLRLRCRTITDDQLGVNLSNYVFSIHGGAMIDQLGLMELAQQTAHKLTNAERPEWFLAMPQDQTRYVISIAGIIASAVTGPGSSISKMFRRGVRSLRRLNRLWKKRRLRSTPRSAEISRRSDSGSSERSTVRSGLPILPPLARALLPQVDPQRRQRPPRVVYPRYSAGYFACRTVLGAAPQPDTGVGPHDVVQWITTLNLAVPADSAPPRILRDWASNDYPPQLTWAPVYLGLVVALEKQCSPASNPCT